MNKTERVYSSEQYDASFPPSNLKAFISHFVEIYNAIPDEYKDEAEIDIDTASSYDSYYAEIEVRYTRPETEQEYALRIGDEEARRMFLENQERAQLAILQARYGTSSS
jgi:hypothetical protein